MKLSVYNLKGLAYEGDVTSLTAKTASGEVTVLDHHRPLISILTAGQLTARGKDGEQKIIPVSGGFLEVRPNNEISVILS